MLYYIMETVNKIMTKSVFTAKESDDIYYIAKVMKRKNIGSCIILKNKKPIGIITERDLTQKVLAKNLLAKKTKAKDIMSSPCSTTTPEANIFYVNKFMDKKKFKKMPVVNKAGNLVGVLTQTDLNKYFTAQRKKFVLSTLNKTLRGSYPI